MNYPGKIIASETEVGIVKMNFYRYLFCVFLRLWRTKKFAKANGYNTNEWIGLYEKGTEKIYADFGCLPNAEQNALFVLNALRDAE